MKKSLPIFLSLLAIWFCMQSCHKSNGNFPKVKNIYTVDGLLSFSGDWSSLGLNSRAAMDMAVTNINSYLTAKNADFRLATDYYDTKLYPSFAQNAFEQVINTGVHFVIGPQSSDELAAITGKADSNNVIVVSTGSTAASIAIAGDPVYSFCPSDNFEGAAIADTIYKSGIRGLVTLARLDPGNVGLQNATGAAFSNLGGHISAIQAYNTSYVEISGFIGPIKSQVDALSQTYGINNVAVYVAGYNECTSLFDAAKSDPLLSQVRWYGSDGLALNPAITSDPTASAFAVSQNFFASSFQLPQSLKNQWQPIADNIRSITGVQPDGFALSAYDAMWVIAKTIEASEGKNFSFAQLKSAFVAQANSYTGITGSTALDNYGDRNSGNYDFYGIVKNGSTYSWSLVGQSN